jgi:hypothetical protein
LARYEGKFEAAAETSIGIDELLDALGRASSDTDGSRRDAIARCLSLSEGWRDAADSLGGAFARLGMGPGLTSGKE